MKKYISITIFSVLFACGIVFFLEPNHLAPGGVTGISILLHTITGISTGTWVFANSECLAMSWLAMDVPSERPTHDTSRLWVRRLCTKTLPGSGKT